MDLNSRTQGTFFISSRKRKRSSNTHPNGPSSTQEEEEERTRELELELLKKEGYERSWRVVEGRIEVSSTHSPMFGLGRKRNQARGRERRRPGEGSKEGNERKGGETPSSPSPSSFLAGWVRQTALESLNSKTLLSVLSFVRSCHPPDAFPTPFPAIPTAVVSGQSERASIPARVPS